ncbi:hypothetical protein CLHOM_01560 [Clostridium homopropionicum DSM 5847]|uniref:Uncharacterized protein n=1 Tax=Clostridium homopropionicum DSM 5847 TaxID=1121318 RepID=A0A0L6ZET3_9CLOT|nr:transcription factor [Clostridium homopropionicum]KOA21485.1 hypothetical protein CLHOM_01560 [Clostridium homopropionicum DSM 5847]SFG08188.1 hypothetical protein SAMN04488501_10565 [Clostridium homopropionicum]
MNTKYNKKEILKSILTIAGLLSIPTLMIKDKIKNIRHEELQRRTLEKIIKNTMELDNNLCNLKAIQYLQFIQSVEIPDKTLCKNIIIEGFKMIKDSKEIDDRIKGDLRFVLECKGVSFLY